MKFCHCSKKWPLTDLSSNHPFAQNVHRTGVGIFAKGNSYISSFAILIRFSFADHQDQTFISFGNVLNIQIHQIAPAKCP
jgi:hypothetical protein